MDSRLQRILRQHVRTDALLGLEQVPMNQAPVKGGVPGETQAKAEAQQVAAQPVFEQRVAQPAGAGGDVSDATPAIEIPDAPLDLEAKRKLLRQMDEQEVRGCTKCDLCQGRTQTVFGEGSPDAQIMFVGEGPGQNEDEQGRPFVGRAGELLTKMINAMGLDRDTVYIANIVKCRPPNNRTPTPAEIATCWDYLRRQMQIIRPQAIITLGGPATKTLLDTKVGITRLRGTWHEYAGVQPPIPVMPTFHPAYLLRAYTRDNRAKVWSDLQAVLKYAGQAKD